MLRRRDLEMWQAVAEPELQLVTVRVSSGGVPCHLCSAVLSTVLHHTLTAGSSDTAGPGLRPTVNKLELQGQRRDLVMQTV